MAVASLLLLLSACAPKPVTSGGPPSGTWSGDYGPDTDRRDPVKLELKWEDTNLRGTVRAGTRSIDLTQASFKADTGAIKLEFEAQANGRPVHYVVEGKVDGDKMSGTWSHDGQQGDFRLTKQ
jgi:hypothetical protein